MSTTQALCEALCEASRGLDSLICKMGLKKVPTSRGLCEIKHSENLGTQSLLISLQQRERARMDGFLIPSSPTALCFPEFSNTRQTLRKIP